MNQRCVVCLAIALFVLAVYGCGGPDLSHLPKTVEAKGVITLDGDPYEGAAIVFLNDSGDTFARGMSDAKGRFSLDVFEEKPGAIPGTYKAMASRTVETEDGSGWKNDLPKKYETVKTSGWEIVIPEEGVTDIKLDMVSN